MKSISGVLTALVTPFKNDKVDFESLGKLLKAQLNGGVSGFVVGGTTGESPTVTKEELEAMYQFVRKNISAETSVILGTGTNSTQDTVQKTQWAERLKADAALVVTPYYNKPPQAGMVAHYRKISAESQIPLLIYNVPGRTGVSIQPETIAELSQVENIVGVKDATGDLQILEKMKPMVRSGFILLSGDDKTTVEYCFKGGHGVISVLSHLIPGPFAHFVARARSGDERAVREFEVFHRLSDLIFIEANPIPVKAALQDMNIIASDELRLPLVPMSQGNRDILKAEMKAKGLL